MAKKLKIRVLPKFQKPRDFVSTFQPSIKLGPSNCRHLHGAAEKQLAENGPAAGDW